MLLLNRLKRRLLTFFKGPSLGRTATVSGSPYLGIIFLVTISAFVITFLQKELGSWLHFPHLMAQVGLLFRFASDGLAGVLVDWNTASLAAAFFLLALLDYLIRKNWMVLLLGSVFLFSGATVFFHSLTLDGFEGGESLRQNFEAWSWFLGSLCLSIGLVLIVFLSRGLPRSRKRRITLAALGVVLLALGISVGFWVCLVSPAPNLVVHGFTLGRPAEFIPFFFYLLLGAYFTHSCPRSLPRHLNRFLALGLLPLSAAQVAIALSGNSYEGFFVDALFLRMIGYFLPVLGLAMDYLHLRQEWTWRASQNQFEMVAETSSDGILTVNNDNRITFINRAAADIFGYDAEELFGHHIFRLVPPEHRKTILATARNHLDSGIKSQQWDILELSGLHKNGQTITLEASINEFFNRQKHFFTVILRNVTERKKFQEALQSREQYHRSLIENSSDLIGILSRDGQFLYASPSYERILGYPPNDLYGRGLVELLHPEDRLSFLSKWENLLKEDKEGSGISFQVRLLHHDHHWRLFEMSLDNLLRSPSVLGIVVNARDITEQKRAEDALRENAERYELVARGSNGGLWDWDLRTNTVYYSSRWKSILGYEENEIGNLPEDWFDRVHPDDLAHLRLAIKDHLEGKTDFLEYEHRMLRKNGDYIWVAVRGIAVRGGNGAAARLAGSQTDISRQKGVEEQFRFQAFHDTLTGLPNRNLLIDRLQQAIRMSHRSNFKFAVLFLDIDRFKGINDGLGHLAGDQLLKETSRRLEKCLRPGDTAARLGGDEFTILLENIKGVKESVQIAERILKELSIPYFLDEKEVFATASIGIAMGGSNYNHPEDLLRDADTAMYRAKANGRSRYEIFDVDMHKRVVALLQMENDLWRAINHQEFIIHYQPILSLRTGYIEGFEALVRWQHPEKGLLSPMEFIPLAEETGLIINIGEWLLKAACVQNREWQQMGFPNLRLAVNFSARQLRHPDPLKMVQDILWETRMSPQTLELEITESIAMKTSDPGLGALSKLRLMGMPISIDDFGTGYSSLSSLKHSPATTLKIDKSFLKDIQTDADNAAITNTIIAMAHSLQLRVIAEGVETEQQLEFLAERGCDEVQGHYFSRPLTAQKATDFLRQSNPFPLKQRVHN